MFPSFGEIFDLRSFRSERSEWGRFGKAILWFVVVPLGLVTVLCEILCWQSGETIPDAVAANLQMKNPAIEWAAHRVNDAVRFKLIRVNQERPEILFMGESRGSQFRREMFKPYSFYNFSRVSMTLDSMPELLRRLPADYTPKVIIFNLDFFQFIPRFAPFYATVPVYYSKPSWKVHLISLHDALVSLMARPLSFIPGTTVPTIGMNARLDRVGFRADGSAPIEIEHKGPGGTNPLLYETAPWNTLPSLYYGSGLNPKEEAGLEEFAMMAKARGIILIGVQMPMYGPVVRKMEGDPNYGTLRDFREQVDQGYFDRLGIIFCNYLEFPPYSDDYRNFADFYHPMEKVATAVVHEMAKDPRVKAVLPGLDAEASGK